MARRQSSAIPGTVPCECDSSHWTSATGCKFRRHGAERNRVARRHDNAVPATGAGPWHGIFDNAENGDKTWVFVGALAQLVEQRIP